jgi:hypothetical protein
VKTAEQLKDQLGDISRFLTSDIGEQFDAVEAALGGIVAALQVRPAAELSTLRSEIKEMIEFVTKRSEAADAERFKYLQSSLQIIGFVLVFSSFALAGLDKTITWSPGALGVGLSLFYPLVVAMVGAVLIVVTYFAQARFRYPFVYYKQLGNSWRWFYYGNISADTPEGEFFYRNAQYQRRYATNYASDLERYVKRYVGDPLPQQIVDDLRQLFLLMSHDRYKQKFKQHLVHAALYTGLAAGAAFVGGLFGTLYAASGVN